VHQAEASRVKRLAGKSRDQVREFGIEPAGPFSEPAVASVTDHGVPGVGQVHPDLVGSAGFQAHAQMGQS
jgi:hypothetical protein